MIGWLCIYDLCIRIEHGVFAELIVGDEPPGESPTVNRGWVLRED